MSSPSRKGDSVPALCPSTRTLIFLMGLVVFSFPVGCSSQDDPKPIDMDKRVVLSPEKTPSKGQNNVLHFAVGAMITPTEGFGYYRRLLDYLEEKMGRDVEYVDRKEYAEVNALLESGYIDAAFVCSGPYVTGHRQFGLELLLAPQAYGAPVYYSYIIVNKDSDIRELEDLRGRTFAFTDPDSNSGRLSPTYILAGMGETPDSFFGSYEFTYAHDKSIEVVARNLVDGAAVDSLIWDYIARKNPELTDRTRIITKSEPYGIPPLVVRPGLPENVKAELKSALLDMAHDPRGREILDGMMIERFIETEDRAYDTIREMQARVAKVESEE